MILPSLSIIVHALANYNNALVLLGCFRSSVLQERTAIWGYARSDLTDDDLRDRLRPFLEKEDHSKKVIDEFLNLVHYKSGKGYGDVDAFADLNKQMEEYEKENDGMKEYNRMFYFAIPPNVFADTAVAIKQTCMQDPEKGFSRVVVEKPFGRDTESFEKLNKEISDQFSEDTLYRIDRKLMLHYIHVHSCYSPTLYLNGCCLLQTFSERTWFRTSRSFVSPILGSSAAGRAMTFSASFSPSKRISARKAEEAISTNMVSQFLCGSTARRSFARRARNDL